MTRSNAIEQRPYLSLSFGCPMEAESAASPSCHRESSLPRLPFVVEIEYKVLRTARNLRVGFTLTGNDGTAVLTSSDMDGTEGEMERGPGTYLNRCKISGNFLNYGQYSLRVGSDFPMIQAHFNLDRAIAFSVEQTGGVGGSIPDGRKGLLRIQLPWDTQRID